jgi:hypothetical protein
MNLHTTSQHLGNVNSPQISIVNSLCACHPPAGILPGLIRSTILLAGYSFSE